MTTEENPQLDDDSTTLACASQSGESNTTCMICMEEWTIGSEHRLCCLKCGHLYGRSCIEKWIKEKGSTAKCPHCNKPAKKSDLRDLWCKAIKASDTTELQQLQKALENERRLRKTDSAVIFHNNLKIELLHAECDKLKANVIEKEKKIVRLQSVINRYNQLRAQKLANNSDTSEHIELNGDELDISDSVIEVDIQPRELKGMFHFAEKVEFSSKGGCKSFGICTTSAIILVAQPLPQTNMFGDFGLRKYSVLETTARECIPLHSKMITAIQVKPIGDLVLTASQDKKVRVTSISNNSCIQSYHCQYEPTCLAWSTHRDQQFYVGSSNCYVSLYDLRNTSECIYQTSQKIANTRLLSIASTNGPDTMNGLIANDSRGSQFLEVSQASSYESQYIDNSVEHMDNHSLPFDGLMGTVDYDKKLNLSLITTRRCPLTQNCTHNLVKLKRTEAEDGTYKVECDRVRTFFGGRSPELLGQSRILRHPTLENNVLIGACDDSANGIKLWDASDNTEYQTIRTDRFIRDMILYTPDTSNQHVLYALSDRGLNIYRWDYA